ncbi:ABC transporter substrate-binding protein [Pseudomonas sp. GOM6]|uniref:substrate-binding periplasmic protein n=1 Tax=unclassified Pseudomonas TaxID=196821 RepID=UPI0024090E4C|nr:ABC transporter substrate-binding protein [Pseudomonas sp. GOM6]MDG1582740.1 ABC transporter substrate-binding protein [Pseudomonas sp. GOM6]
MRLIAVVLLLLCHQSFAAERPLRFSVNESWGMPMMRYEQGRAAGGILFDLHQRLAEKIGRQAQQLVLPRQRVQQVLLRGEIDVRCYVNPDWVKESHHQYIWSLPFMVQRDLLVSRHDETALPGSHSGERIGTVLGFIYPTLEPQIASGLIQRDDARTQELALEKLIAGRYRFAVSNQLTLDWFNRNQPPAKRLRPIGELAADLISCLVRDEPDVPTQRLLRAMVQMKQDGEFDAILARYR